MTGPLALLRRLLEAAVQAADPMRSLAAHLLPRPVGRCGIGLPASAQAVLAGETGVIAPQDPRLSRI
jgi:hydroxypyruvate reductase